MFKQIPLYNGNFYINENGEIYNSKTKNFIHPYIGKNGYKYIDLRYNGNRYRWLYHRLIATMFCKNPNNYPIVLHIDSNPLNCNIYNLKWGTYSQNNKQAYNEGHLKMPTPDNRKYYILYLENNSIVNIECKGVKSIINKLGFGKDNTIRNYIHRNSSIPIGIFKGWKIKNK